MNAAPAIQIKLAHRSAWLMLSLGLLIGLAKPVAAQAIDPPARVARVAEVVGDAWLFDTENKEWTRVTRNQTVGEGDRLRTDERSRISLRIGSASVWLDERSDLAFDQLDEGQVLMLLDKGDVGLRLRAQETVSDFRVRTREGMVFPDREGLYRVEQLDRGSRAFVFNGRLRFESARGGSGVPPVWLQAGEQAEFWWADGARVERQRLDNDAFSDWLLAQNRNDKDMSVAQRYVSPEMTGADELDRNGNWQTTSEFGVVWFPTAVNVGWVPYRDGRWVWTSLWGWSWVDDAPWGFAPFHYGRWVRWGGRWCWSPGQYVKRPVYAPALVAWVGGPRVSVGINIGNRRDPPPRQGWYPLAPREAYVPSYRHSPTYVVRVNNGDREQGGRDQRPHRNREVPGAVSYLPGQGRPAQALPPVQGPAGPALTPVSAPTRGEFAGVQPQPRQRPTVPVPVQAAPPVVGVGNGANPNPVWRSENPRENQGRRDWQRERGEARELRGVVTSPLPVTSPMPAAPAMPAVPAAPAVVAQPQFPQRPAEAQPWRGRERGLERDRERGDRGQEAMPVRAAPQQAVIPTPQAAPVEPQRQFERPQPQPQPQRAQQMSMPAAQAQQAPQPRAEDRAPQRPRAEGPGRGGRDRERNESER
jgi:hypothetical protein